MDDFRELFDEYSRYIDEPVADVASMSQWALYKKAKSLGFIVLLSGLGGDELFMVTLNQIKSPDRSKSNKSIRIFSLERIQKKLAFLRFMATNWKYVLQAGYPCQINDKTTVPWTYNDYIKFVSNARLKIQR